MKKIITSLAIILFFNSNIGYASDIIVRSMNVEVDSNVSLLIKNKTDELTAYIDKSCNCLIVETKKAKFRIQPCGQIEKQVWQVINKNENDGATIFNGTYQLDTTVSDNVIHVPSSAGTVLKTNPDNTVTWETIK